MAETAGTSIPPEGEAPLPAGSITCLALAAFAQRHLAAPHRRAAAAARAEFSVSLGQAAQRDHRVLGRLRRVAAVLRPARRPLRQVPRDRLGLRRLRAHRPRCAASRSASRSSVARGSWPAHRGGDHPAVDGLDRRRRALRARQPVLARFLIGQILGLSAGVFVGGFAADHLSWRAPFSASASASSRSRLTLFALSRRLPAHARAMRHGTGHRSSASCRRVRAGARQPLGAHRARHACSSKAAPVRRRSPSSRRICTALRPGAGGRRLAADAVRRRRAALRARARRRLVALPRRGRPDALAAARCSPRRCWRSASRRSGGGRCRHASSPASATTCCTTPCRSTPRR